MARLLALRGQEYAASQGDLRTTILAEPCPRDEIAVPSPLDSRASFRTNPAGSAIVNAIGPIRQVVRGEDKIQRRYLVVAPGTVGKLGTSVQVQAE